jgi:hypothetical protein
VRSTIMFWLPRTVLEDAVSGVPVTVPVVAEPAVNGEPVPADRVPKVCRPHSVTVSGPV